MSVSKLVSNVLISSEIDVIKPFTVGGFTFHAGYLKGVAAYISLFDKPSVVHSSHYKYDGKAEYIPKSNKLIIGFQSTLFVENKGIIVHEGTHAACDMLGIQMSSGDSEVIAYVAQCQYMRGNYGSSRLESNDSIKDGIFEKAWAIAEMIQDGGFPSTQAYANLRQQIAKHPDYANSAQPAGFDYF